MAYPTSPFVDYATKAAQANNIPPELLLGLITTENGSWDPHATNVNTNGTYDYGLTQLNSQYYPDAVTMTPYQQIDKTASILAANYKAKGNWFDAIGQYHSSTPTIAQDYATKVFGFATDYGYQANNVPDAVNTGAPLDPYAPPGQTQVDSGGGIHVYLPGSPGTVQDPGSSTGTTGGTPPGNTTTPVPSGTPGPVNSTGIDLSKLPKGLNLALLAVGALIAILAVASTFQGGGGTTNVQVKPIPVPV